jgi:WD40 repeat protein
MAATQAGVILGTAAYMSPEQAKGFQTDSRGDIFSFGCVLYEMLTGRQAFHGDTAAEVLASVLVRDVEWSFLPPNLNPRIYDLLRRCLEKNPKRRWQSTTDMRAELEAIAREPRPPSIQASPAITRNYWKAAAVLFFFGMIVIAAAAWFVYPRQAEQRVIRFNVSAPEKTALMRNEGFVGSEGFAVSPDGGNFAFLTRDVKSQLWVQPVDSITPRPIPNTDDVANTNFFWSDDSRSIAFVAQGRLKRVDVYGGPGQTICNAATLRGGTWNSKGEILFAMDNGPIYRVPATGGSPLPVTKLENESSHRSPRFLPDGRHFLYLVIGSDVPTVSVGDIMTGSTKRLFAADTGAIYVPQGFVLFIRQGILLAQEFDAAKLEMIGDPKPLAESVSYALGGQNLGLASFSASTNGILTYRSGTSNLLDNVRLTWVDRSGKELGQVGKADPYRGVDLSPDGKKLAVHRHDGTGGDLWVFESQRPTPSRLTFDASQENASPIWSPDGKQIAFGSLRAGMWGIYQKTADGSGDERQLFQSKLPIMPMSWAPDSQSLVFWQRDKSSDLWTLPLNDPKRLNPF